MNKQSRSSLYLGLLDKCENVKSLKSLVLFALITGLSFSANAQTINSFPYSQNFESFSTCGTGFGNACVLSSGWVNATIGDQLDWTVDINGTGSLNTGPTANGGADHNPGVSGGKYLYLETSGGVLGDQAHLETPIIETTAADSNLVFDYWYHMFGSTVRPLVVQIQTITGGTGGAWTTIDSIPIASQDLWIQSTFSLNSFVGDTFKIRFIGENGTSFTGDVALDDVSIYQVLSNDAGIASIDAPISPITAGSNNVNVTIQNFGGGTITSATINYTVNGVTQTPFAWTGSLTNNQTASVSLGASTFAAGLSTIVAWTTAPNGATDPILSNDTATTTVCTALAGTYTVGGVGADIADITALSDLLNSCGISAPCVFNINPGTYSGQRLIMDHVVGSSATNTIMVNGGDASLVTIESSIFSVVYLNGTANVTIKNLTLQATGTIDAYGVQLRDNANNCLIDSCHIMMDLVSTSADIVGVSASNLETSSTSEGQNTNYTIVSNCLIEGGVRGIHFEGENATRSSGNQFINNLIRNVDDYGIFVDDQDSIVIHGNTIEGVVSSVGEGIHCTDIMMFEITNNTALNIPDWGLYIFDGNFDDVPTSRGLIANNMISSTADYGAYIDDLEETDIWHNTFYGEPGIRLNNLLDVDIRNNIFVSDGDFAFETDDAGPFAALDYNLYLRTDGGDIVDYGPTLYATLADWQTGEPTFNINSIETDPVFLGGKGDLHVLSQLADNLGVTIPSILTDIDGDSRPAGVAVDMGADEFTALAFDAAFEAYLDPASGCGDASTAVRVVIKNLGGTTIVALPITVNVTGDITQTLNATYAGSLVFNTLDTITVGTINTTSGGDIALNGYTALVGDQNMSNDTLALAGVHFTPLTPVGIDGSACTNIDSGYISAQAEPSAGYEWFAAEAGGTALASGDSFLVPSIAAQSTYYVQYADNQDSLETTFAGGNGQDGIMFDITAINSFALNGLTISPNSSATGRAIDIYYIANGTYVGNETTPGAWTSLYSGTYDPISGVPYFFDLSASGLTIPAGSTYAIYVDARGVNYTSGVGGAGSLTAFSNANMTINSGVGKTTGFGATFDPRIFNGRIHYGFAACSNTRVPVTINKNINPDFVSLGNDTFFCETSAEISAALQFTPQSYAWSTADVTDTISIASTDQYIVDVVDTFNCYSSDTVNITFYTPAVVNLGADDNYCETDSFQLDAGTLTSYAWSNGATTQITHATTPGTYDVQAIDLNGCMVNDTIELVQMPLPDVAFSYTDTNLLDLSQFNATATTLAMGTITSRDWKFGDGNTATGVSASNTFPSPGLFTVTHIVGTATGCSDSSVQTLQIVAPPEVRFSHVDTCLGSGTVFNGSFSTVSIGTITGYLWDFGDGNTANSAGHVHTYADTGLYMVKLTAFTSTGGKDSLERAIRIEPTPVTSFSSTEVCKGEVTYFTNNSSISGGSFTSEWFYGDGFSDVNNNATVGRVYANPLKFNARLETTSDKGCKSQLWDSVFVNPIPESNFTAANVCEGQQVLFTNTSSISTGSFTASWEYGDGNSSSHPSLLNSVHLYSNDLTYSARLTTTSDKGCVSNITKPVTVYQNPVANFTVGSACQGDAVYFNNTSTMSTGNINYNWTFGDGTSSTSNSPSHVYSNVITYNATLYTTSNQGCTDQITKQVTIHPIPVANFTTTGACLNSGATFTNTSSIEAGGNTYAWNLGDGTIDSVANLSHIYPAIGTYTVSLKATSIHGCNTSMTKTVDVYPNPTPNFTTTEVCLGSGTLLTSTSSIAAGSFSYLWSHGDGTTDVVGPVLAHTFADALTYDVTLKLTSDKGCTAQLTKPAVVNPLPTPAFIMNSVCQGVTTNFNNTSGIETGTITSSWTFGDGISSTVVSPSHIYSKALSYPVTLKVVSDKGCKAQLTKAAVVYHNPVAEFVVQDACDGVAAVFTNQSTSGGSGAFDRLWTFHDGTTDGPFHSSKLYPGPGTYSVTLDVSTGNGCTDQMVKTVTIHPNPVADFTTADVCDLTAVSFNNTSSVSSGVIANNLWHLGNGNTSQNGIPTVVYSNTGTYNVRLEISSDQGCTDQITKQVTVHPNPQARFTTSDGCLGSASNFTNASAIESGSFTNAWTFGDGNTSTNVSPSNTYASIGSYDVKLILTSDQGCTGEATGEVLINPNPVPSFTAGNVCLGGATFFSNTSRVDWGSFTNAWTFGDGNVSPQLNPANEYLAVGTYNVRLDLTSNFGCTASLTKSVEVFANPVAGFTVDNVCDGFEIAPNNTSTGATINNWRLGDGTNSTDVSPRHTYIDGPRTYAISLAVENANGCKDNTTGNVTIYGSPIVKVGPDVTIGKGLPVQLSATGGGTYVWTPSFELDNPNAAKPTARVSGDTEFEVVIEDGNGCMDTGYVNVFTLENYVVFPRSVITPNGDGINDKFTIDNLNSYPNNSIVIFDRWGREVYSQDAYQQDWEGTKDGSALPADTYFFILTFDKNEDAIYKGSVTINKSNN